MKRVLILCLFLPLFAFGQGGEYYYAQSTGNLNFVLYSVKQQEPYKDIASRFGLSVQEIMYLNGGNIHSIARMGDQMIIPLTTKNFYRWKDIPADVSVEPVYIQLKRITNLQEIVQKYHLRADYFAHWNDTQESRFDAGAELIVGYLAYNTTDEREEKPLTKSFPFESPDFNQEKYSETGDRNNNRTEEMEEIPVTPKRTKTTPPSKRVAATTVRDDMQVPSARKTRPTNNAKPTVQDYSEEETEPIVPIKKSRITSQPKQVTEDYNSDNSETIPKNSKLKTNPAAKRNMPAEDYEDQPQVAPKKSKTVNQPRRLSVEEMEEETPVVTKKTKVVRPSKMVVQEDMEEEEPIEETPKKVKTNATRRVIQEEMEEEPVVMIPKKSSKLNPPKRAIREEVEEEPEPKVIPRKTRGNYQTKQAVSNYDQEEDQENIPVPKSKPSSYQPRKYTQTEEEQPVILPKKSKVANYPKKTNEEEGEEEQQPVIVSNKNRNAKASKQVVQQDQEEESDDMTEESEEEQNYPKMVDKHAGVKNGYKKVNGRIDTSFLNSPTKSRSKQNDDYSSSTKNNNRYNQVKGKAQESKSSKKANQNTEEQDESENLTDDGLSLNEVPLDQVAEEANNEVVQPKATGKASKQRKRIEKPTEESEEGNQDLASENPSKPEKANSRGGKASMFVAGLGKKGGKHYVLTNLAERGETIVITNTSNGKFITAEVMGPLPVRELSKGILIKVSENAKDYLDVHSNFFNVMVNY